MNGTNSIQVFVTHKSEDIQRVKQFIQILQLYDAEERLIFFVVEEMPGGRDWRQFIHRSIVEANVLFFLMISPTNKWEWCIYEAGLFAGSRFQESTSNVIIFFDPSKHTLPSPLEHLQAFKANQDDIERFLRQFYGTYDLTGIKPPINHNFAKNSICITEVAKDICALLTSSN
jgi:hypothetical protein